AGGLGGGARLALPRRPPRDRRALLPERPHARATARRVGRQARRLPLPPAALESGPRGGAGGDAGGARAGTLHPPVRPRRRREPVRRDGRAPSAVAIRRDVYVGESPGEAKAVLEAALARGYRGFGGEALVAGSVDEVVERLRALGAMGYTDVIVRHLTDEPSEVLGSLARL